MLNTFDFVSQKVLAQQLPSTDQATLDWWPARVEEAGEQGDLVRIHSKDIKSMYCMHMRIVCMHAQYMPRFLLDFGALHPRALFAYPKPIGDLACSTKP